MPNLISTDGKTISVNRAGGATIPFKSCSDNATFDADNNILTGQIDISDVNLRFVAGSIAVDLVADANDPQGKLIVLTKDQVASLPSLGLEFVVVDLDRENTEQPWWAGRIKPYGSAA